MGKARAVLFVFLLFTGCSGNKEEPTGVIPHTQMEALKKARGVEDSLKKQEQELRKRVDQTIK